MPDNPLPSASDIHAAMPRAFLKFWDLITDGWKLMAGRDDIKVAMSDAIEAFCVAAQSADRAAQAGALAARDVAVSAEKLRVLKELVITKTD